MSAFGTKRTRQSLSAMSAFGGKADIGQTTFIRELRACAVICDASHLRSHAVERAFHLLLNALHGTSADAALTRDLAYAFPATQMHLDALFERGINPRPTELLALRRCGDGLVTVKTCECHTRNSRIWHYYHAGYYCHTFDGSCRK
jgi:hypothetical protein